MHQLPSTPRFIVCKYVPTDSGKLNKIPLNPHTFKPHDPFDSTIHMDYDTAKQLAELSGDDIGIGFVFIPEDRYFFIDIDNCLLEDNRNWNALALDTITLFPNAYIEVSKSGRGIHIIARYEGQRILHHCKRVDLGLEVYTGGRFVALAEIHPNGDAQTIHTHTFVDYLARLNMIPTHSNAQFESWTTESNPECNVPEDDLVLIDFFLNKAATAPEAFGSILHIKDLWENNTDLLSKVFPSNNPDKIYDYSSADAALAHRLHYFTGGNCERVLNLMKQSKLYRDKWERDDYLPRTILKARGNNFFKHGLPRPVLNNTQTVNQNQQNLDTTLLYKENYPELSRNYKALDTANNLKFLLDSFGITVRWNMMNRIREINFQGLYIFKEDEENYGLRIIKDIATRNEMPITRIDEHLDTLAQQDIYHPIVEGLRNNPWDFKPRLNDFIATIESSNPELSYKLIRRWMISAVAAAHSENGFSSSGVLVLSGPQYIGKTRFIKSLDPFNCNAVKGGVLLDPTNKDCMRMVGEHWIVELGELDASFRKSDIAKLKSYLTEDVDKIRLPFARKESIFPRRTSFAASVNDPNFLVDKTGNRRWWTVPCLSINLNHNIDIVQVWAEVYYLWKQGESSWLTQDEFSELNIANIDHEQLDPLEELLYTHFDFSEGWRNKELHKFQSSEVLIKLGYIRPTRSQATTMGQLLKKVTGRIPVHRYHKLLPKT